MKKAFSIFLIVFVLLGFAACDGSDMNSQEPTSSIHISSDNSTVEVPELISGRYYAVGEYPAYVVPYFVFDFNENTFKRGEGDLISFAENGNLTLEGNRLTAVTEINTFVFEILETNKIKLIQVENDDYLSAPLIFELKKN